MRGIRVRHRRAGGPESGYMLLFLMLAVALLTITLLDVAQNYRRSIVREREVEMIHRGAQYARAVRRYYLENKGNYPISIEQLENTNNIRYLRKRYKDPTTKDGEWQIVHITDPGLLGLGIGTTGTGLTPANPSQTNTSTMSNGTTAATSTGGVTDQTAAETPSTTDTASSNSTATGNNPATSGETLGGGLGPMLGVVSKSKTEGIHSFNGKSKYSEWYFLYAPTQEAAFAKGSLITGPFNPNLAMGAALSSTTPGGQAKPATAPTTTPNATPLTGATPVGSTLPTTNP